MVDRVSMSDERRGESQKGPRLFGLRSKIGADCVAALENTTSIPGARRLAITDFSHNATVDIFETASRALTGPCRKLPGA